MMEAKSPMGWWLIWRIMSLLLASTFALTSLWMWHHRLLEKHIKSPSQDASDQRTTEDINVSIIEYFDNGRTNWCRYLDDRAPTSHSKNSPTLPSRALAPVSHDWSFLTRMGPLAQHWVKTLRFTTRFSNRLLQQHNKTLLRSIMQPFWTLEGMNFPMVNNKGKPPKSSLVFLPGTYQYFNTIY